MHFPLFFFALHLSTIIALGNMSSKKKSGRNWCSAPNCKNTRENGVRLFTFPKSEIRYVFFYCSLFPLKQLKYICKENEKKTQKSMIIFVYLFFFVLDAAMFLFLDYRPSLRFNSVLKDFYTRLKGRQI